MSRPAAPSFVLLGNPGSRRVRFFQDALERVAAPPARLVAWVELLEDPAVLDAALTAATHLRLDSPGEDFEVHRRILARGAAHMAGERGECLGREAALALAADGSGLRYARQLYLGFCAALGDVGRALAGATHVRCTHPPADVAAMCDKRVCHARFVAAGLAVPPALPPVEDLDALHAAMHEAGVERVFVKPRHGSSAAGIAAYSLHGEQRATLLTPTGLGDDGPFSSLRLRRYEAADDIRTLLDWLLAEGAHVEHWLDKARTARGDELDLRVVVIAGAARHAVVRVARHRSPMTNLHLGNARGDLDALRERLGPLRWRAAMETCEAAAARFPDSLCVGVDLLLGPALEPVVLEVNAFGDLLPGVAWQGMDTYEVQVRAALAGTHLAP